MKNVITVIVFALVALFTTNSAVAQSLTQDADRPEVIAKTKTAQLNEMLQLNGDQQRTVFRALVANEVSYKKQINGKDINNASVIANKKKVDAALTTSMKNTLTADQFLKWQALTKQ